MLNDLPALGECRQYRMQLPRPKVGKACTDGFLALGLMSCEAICTGLEPLPDKVPAANDFCRKFMKEYPKPTVHKACKHGASRGFDLAAEAAREKFSLNGGEDGGPPAQDGELRAEPVRQAAAKEAPKQEAPKPPAPPLPEDARRLLASLPVTVDEEEVYLKIFEGQDATEEILAFCSRRRPSLWPLKWPRIRKSGVLDDPSLRCLVDSRGGFEGASKRNVASVHFALSKPRSAAPFVGPCQGISQGPEADEVQTRSAVPRKGPLARLRGPVDGSTAVPSLRASLRALPWSLLRCGPVRGASNRLDGARRDTARTAPISRSLVLIRVRWPLLSPAPFCPLPPSRQPVSGSGVDGCLERARDPGSTSAQTAGQRKRAESVESTISEAPRRLCSKPILTRKPEAPTGCPTPSTAASSS